jgi:2-oxoglutarate ferredoxin oxidoreductase subunit delta
MPLDAEAQEIVVGKVNVLEYRCKGCKYCIEFCPKDVLEESKEFNEKGYYPPVVKEEGKCINCNFCETVCPEFAIYVTELERRPLEQGDIIREPVLSRRRRRNAR